MPHSIVDDASAFLISPLKCGTRECSSHFAKPGVPTLNFLQTSSLETSSPWHNDYTSAMTLSHIQQTARSMRVPSFAAIAALESALSSLWISSEPISRAGLIDGRRNASHQAQGRANGAKQGPGKRLGAKKTGGQYVVPGNILFKQRGTHWFPGDGCFMVCHLRTSLSNYTMTNTSFQGRDHTIHADVPGYVKYYRDPALHPKRKYIGVVFERNNPLPQPPNAVRKRKLGMLAYQMPATTEVQEAGDLTNLASTTPPGTESDDAGTLSTVLRQRPQAERQTKTVRSVRDGEVVETKLTLRPGYQWRQANWEIGRSALRSKKAMSVAPFKPGDRFAAWRKRTARRERNAERRAMGRGGKKKK